jgi:hypothetical protein
LRLALLLPRLHRIPELPRGLDRNAVDIAIEDGELLANKDAEAPNIGRIRGLVLLLLHL